MDRMLATWFGAGLLRPAPGTWGSAVAVAMGLILHRIGHFPLLALATGLVILLGFWVVPRYTAGMDDPDRSEIVIDEVAGQWLALMAPSFGFWHAGLPADSFPILDGSRPSCSSACSTSGNRGWSAGPTVAMTRRG